MSIFREVLAFVLAGGISLAAVCTAYLIAREFKITVTLNQHKYLLMTAGVLFVISRYLPTLDFIFSNQTIVQHFVGGGFVSALVYIYIKHSLHMKTSAQADLLFGFTVVSTLGTLNELLEYFVTVTGFYVVDGSDVWIDIVSNTTGCMIALIAYRASLSLFRKSK